MKTRIILSLAALAFVLPVLFQNCTNAVVSGRKVNTATATNGLSVTGAPQAAKIACDLKASNGAVAQHIDSNAAADFKSANINDATSVNIDCSGTASQTTPQSQLKFYLSSDFTDPNNPNWVEVGSPSISKPALAASYKPYTMAIKVVDPTTNPISESIKAFNINVDCANPTSPNVSSAQFTVTKAERWNYFNYSVGGVQDTHDLAFQFDFNGDSAIDPFQVGDPNKIVVGSGGGASVNNVYNMYGTTRGLSVLVVNSCGKTARIDADVSLNQKVIADGASATAQAFHYIQGSISQNQGSTDPNNIQRNNSDLLATWYPDDQYRHVNCEYTYASNGTEARFNIVGNNNYFAAEDQANAVYDHGLALTVDHIPDTGAGASAPVTYSSGSSSVAVTKASYDLSKIDELAAAETYATNNGCSVTITISHPEGAMPCDGGQTGIIKPPTVILGDYSCPQMVSSTGRSIKLQNGHFFCEVGPANQCVGGGGGGGGVPPPSQ